MVVRVTYDLTVNAHGNVTASFVAVTDSYLSYVSEGLFTQSLQSLAASSGDTALVESQSTLGTVEFGSVAINTLAPTDRPSFAPSFAKTGIDCICLHCLTC